MFCVVVCKKNHRTSLRFRIREQESLSVFGKNIRCFAINRPHHLSIKKMYHLIGNSPVFISSFISQKERTLLEANGFCILSTDDLLVQQWAIRFAVEILQNFPLSQQILGFIDPEFCYSSLACFALCHLKQVHLLTNRTDHAALFADKMMAEYGAPISFSSDENILSDCPLVFSPSGSLPQADLPVFLPHPPKEETYHKIILHSPQAIFPESLSMLPDDLPVNDLLSLLYSRENCHCIADIPLCSVLLQNQPSSLTPCQATELLKNSYVL